MPTYEYECERCKRVFEVEQKISDAPLTTCDLLDARSRLERFNAFNHAGGALTWTGRSFADHPDRCVCQGTDGLPHRHHDDSRKGFGGCARCGCLEYTPAFTPGCGGSVRRLISGGTSFALKGPGWAKDGYR